MEATITNDERLEQYAYSEDASFVDRDKCAECGDPVVTWTEQVPCCGGEFSCYDVLSWFACDHCRLIGSRY